MKFRDWLKINIDKNRLCEEEVSFESGINIDSLDRMLKGEIIPAKRKTARKLAKLFKLDTEQVYNFMVKCKTEAMR